MTNYFPLPQDMGGAIRVYGLLRALARSNSVHLLALRRKETTPALVSELETALGVTVETFAPPRTTPTGNAARRWAPALLRRMPPWVLAGFDADLAARASMLAPTFEAAVLLDDYAGAYAHAIRRSAPACRIIADKPVVLGAGALLPAPDPGWRATVRDRLGRYSNQVFERRYLRQVDAVVVTSEEEARRYENLYGPRPEVVVSAIDLPPAASRVSGSRSIGWLGSLDGRPVVEGLTRFVESAWEPLGRHGLELLIVGRDPPPSLRRLERIPGVRLIGYVPELGPFFEALAAAVIPLWAGQGIKLKTLTLFGAGLPVAATPVALEGIAAEDGQHCLVADDPKQLAKAIQRLASDDALARALGANARRLVAEHHTWDSVGPRFVDIVDRVLSTPA